MDGLAGGWRGVACGLVRSSAWCDALGLSATFITRTASPLPFAAQVVILPLQRPELFMRGALTKPTKGELLRLRAGLGLRCSAFSSARLPCQPLPGVQSRVHRPSKLHTATALLKTSLPPHCAACFCRPAAVWSPGHRQDDAGQGGGLRERASRGCCCRRGALVWCSAGAAVALLHCSMTCSRMDAHFPATLLPTAECTGPAAFSADLLLCTPGCRAHFINVNMSAM